jgi:hypothetical protein
MVVFSFGAGVQSTAILLLLKHHPEVLIHFMGKLPEVAYFADTGTENQSTYDHLEKCKLWSPIPIEIVSKPVALDSLEPTSDRQIPRSLIPYFTLNPDGTKGMLTRKCTSEFKIVPIQKALRDRLGAKPYQRIPIDTVKTWLGISIEEAQRAKLSQVRWIKNLYPLIEIEWSRTKCANYAFEHLGYYPPKSRCYHCPFTSDWADIKREHPEEFARAVFFDNESREITKRNGVLRGETFIHPSCKPLEIAVSDQLGMWEGDFALECSGHCGV